LTGKALISTLETELQFVEIVKIMYQLVWNDCSIIESGGPMQALVQDQVARPPEMYLIAAGRYSAVYSWMPLVSK
jgi:hypothetical protein